MNVFSRILQKYCRLFFRFRYRYLFKYVGRNACLVKPFRVDGGSSIHIGDSSFIQKGAWLYCVGVRNIDATLIIGKECIFGYNNHITAVRQVEIGDNVLTANNVYISDNIHEYEDITTPVMHQSVRFKKAVIIKDGAWIGENVSIIGASIGKNSVVGANSVVTRDVPDYSVAVGAPARVIRRFDFDLNKWINT